MRRTALALAVVASLHSESLLARTPETAIDPNQGIWIAQGDRFIYQTIDRWSVFSAGATVNKLVVDQNILWVATDDGVIRFETGSQRSTKLTMEDGLPSQRVATVAFDDQYVWFGTNKGLVRYRKTDRTLKVYDESNGLPSKAVTYAVTIGRQVWFGTRAGLAVFSPDVDGLRAFGEADGLASGNVAEVFQFGSDLWCRTDVGLSRFRILQRVFNNFPMSLMGAQQIFVTAVDGQTIWIGTDNGLWQFDDGVDSIRIFPQQGALGSKVIVGVEPMSSYDYFTTDKEVLQYNTLTFAIRRFTAADGLTRQEGSTGTLNLGSFVTVMFADGAFMYDVSLDQWRERSLALTVAEQRKTTGRVFAQLESEEPYVNGRRDTANAYATGIGGFGFGHELSEGRTFNGSTYLDYGQLDASGIRDLQYKVEYLGNQNDVVRDVRIEDKLKYRYVEEGLDRQLLLQGAHVGLATPGAEPKASMSVDTGFRRGQVVRDFITGPASGQATFNLSQQYILPGTERVYVDGELLNNGVDYTVVYTAGQLIFLDPERIDDLSVIVVEYERDLMPKKSLGNLSLSARLPVSNEIGTWAMAGTPAVINTDTGLYNQIDGGAPKYIDRGWVSSVYATYQQGSSTLQVAIHDMGNLENAQSIYQFDIPVAKIPVPGIATTAIQDACIDVSLPTAYYAEAYTGQYYIEITIADHSDAALAYIKTFALEVFNRGTQAGAHVGDMLKEWLVAARGAVAPMKGMELGARVVQLEQTSDNPGGFDAAGNPTSVPAMHLTSGVLDGRYQVPVGGGGLLTSYAELGGSHDSNSARPDGLAGMGFLRLSSPILEGTISERVNSEGWTPVGHTTPTMTERGLERTWNDARFGILRDQTQLNATGYPLPWLPVTALFTRQSAWLADGSDGVGVVQHVIGRVQLNKAGLPATTLQLGITDLDNPNAFQTHRLQGSAQTDYNLAPLLGFAHIHLFNVRAFYSQSDADTQEGTIKYGERVQLVRLEGKLSPSPTETINVLFRSRDVERQDDQVGPFLRSVYHWELTSGAQSSIIPGLVPKGSWNLVYDDTRMLPLGATGCSQSDNGSAITPIPAGTGVFSNYGPIGAAGPVPGANGTTVTPAGAAITPVGFGGPGQTCRQGPDRTITGSIGAALGLYPGQWFAKLGPLALVPSVSVGDQEESKNGARIQYNRVYNYIASEIWAGRRLEMQLYESYRLTNVATPVDADVHDNGSITILQNRIVYRPVFTSPITLLANYERDRTPIDPTQLTISNGNYWMLKDTYQDTLQWLMRWNRVFATRTQLIGTLEDTSNYYTQDPSTNLWEEHDHNKYSGYAELELRFYPLANVSALFIFQRMGVTRWHCSGTSTDAFEAWEFIPVTGVIWRAGDRMYLNGTFTYDHLGCMSGSASACANTTTITPYVYFTMNL
ncbi:MAG: DUF6599 family protein [Polyangia bacterium]